MITSTNDTFDRQWLNLAARMRLIDPQGSAPLICMASAATNAERLMPVVRIFESAGWSAAHRTAHGWGSNELFCLLKIARREEVKKLLLAELMNTKET